ncbi:MAG: hypothetical protein SFV15_14720 [Polyangiaceae bacterium]|nr:hypothetical protein [Polyangiaceae bacterium]
MLTLLLLKVTLAPTLVALAAVLGAKFGQRVAGWLLGFPMVAGPVLWFYAHEQGNLFAAKAAGGAALGVVSLSAFLLTYAWASLRLTWVPCLLLGWAAFALVALPLAAVPAVFHEWWLSLLAAYAALTLTLWGLPKRVADAPAGTRGQNLLLRMIATAFMVVMLTGLASILGATLSGIFTSFPVATTILVVFAQREAGHDRVLAVCEGFVPSMYSFSGFCAALSFALLHAPFGLAFGLALVVSLLSQTLVLTWVTRRAEHR